MKSRSFGRRRGGFAYDELGDEVAAVHLGGAVGHVVEETRQGRFAHVDERLADGGDWGVEVGGAGWIVDGDDGEIVRDFEADPGGDVVDVQRVGVAGGEDGGRAIGAAE